MNVDLFKEIKLTKKQTYHPKFIMIKENLPDVKEKLNEWCRDFIDRDGKMIIEFQTTFHSVFWEIYLFRVFENLQFEINMTYKMPDFLILGYQPFFVEAVVSNIKDNGIDEKERKTEDTIRSLDPPVYLENFDEMMTESIIRLSNSINYKNKKYNNDYIQKKHVIHNLPFILAVASFDYIHFGREYVYPIIALLYGLYYRKHYDDYKIMDRIDKNESGAIIELNLFDKEEYSNISAIIFTSSLTVAKISSIAVTEGKNWNNNIDIVRFDWLDKSKPYKIQRVRKGFGEDVTDGLFIFHNPNAKNPLNIDIFDKARIIQYKLVNGQLKIFGKYPILVRRLALPKILTDNDMYSLMLSGIMTGYNRRNNLIRDYQLTDMDIFKYH